MSVDSSKVRAELTGTNYRVLLAQKDPRPTDETNPTLAGIPDKPI
jgi:hypothetical protein